MTEPVTLAIIGAVSAIILEIIRRRDKNREDRVKQLETDVTALQEQYEEQAEKFTAQIKELEEKVVFWMDRYYSLLKERLGE